MKLAMTIALLLATGCSTASKDAATVHVAPTSTQEVISAPEPTATPASEPISAGSTVPGEALEPLDDSTATSGD